MPDSAPAAPARTTPLTRQMIVAMTLLVLVNILNYFDRLLITVVAQPVKEHFALTDTQIGVLTGPAFVFVYVTATLFFGWLSDRRNRRNIIVWVLMLWSAMTALTGAAQNFLQLAIARAGVGIGEGGSNPAVLSFLGSTFPAESRGRAIAVFQSGGMIGILLTFLVGGWVAAEFGWRAAFLVAGVPGLLLAVAVLLCVREPERQPATDRRAAPPLSESLRLLRTNRAYTWIVVATSIAVIGNLGMLQWLPLFFIRSHGLGLKQIGIFFGPAVASGMMAGMLIGGWIGDRIGRNSPARSLVLCIGATIVLTPLYWTVLWVPSLPLALALTFFATATSVIYSPSVTAVMLSVVQPQVRGMAIAVFNFLNGVLGQALFPVMIGILSDALLLSLGAESLRMALTIVIPVSLLSAMMFVRAMRITAAHEASREQRGLTPGM